MATKKRHQNKGKSGNKSSSSGNTKRASSKSVEVSSSKTSSSSSTANSSILSAAALPGILLAIAAAYWSSWGSSISDRKLGNNNNNNNKSPVSTTSSSPIHNDKNENDWFDGYYTTQSNIDQDNPIQQQSTHALLYPNGGGGNPDMVSFSNDEEFFGLGRLYNEYGQIVVSRSHFRNGTALYRGPERAGTHFQWPPVHVGYKRPVPGLFGGNGKQIELETLTEPTPNASTSDPRIFYIHNFLSPEEADEFIQFSTSEANPHKLAPSKVGSSGDPDGGRQSNKTRTSTNAFDIMTENSKRVKRRGFRLLRMGEYAENLADGIQIIRYEKGQAYVAHHDYYHLKHAPKDHNFLPTDGGSNRFATIFLYLSDVEAGYGGETVFPRLKRLTADKSQELVERLGKAPPIDKRRRFMEEAGLRKGSWEETLMHSCYGAFAVPPRRGDAILFYSQRPDGELDVNSQHGACPVLKGSKWGANLWVWNACRLSTCKEDPMNPADELPDKLKAPFPGGV